MIIFAVGLILLLYGVSAKKYSIWAGMLLVFFIMGFQENCFTDYPSYKLDYENKTLGYTIKETEFVYLWLWNLCSDFINFHLFVTLTSFFQCIIIGLMIKKYVIRRYQFFSVLIVYFTFNIMLIQMTAMRQGYAVEMLLLAYYLLGNHKYLYSLLAAICAFGFHNSAMIAMPFYFIILILIIISNKKGKYSSGDCKIIKKESYISANFWLLAFWVFYFLKYTFFASYINPILMTIDGFSFGGYLEVLQKNTGISLWLILYNSIFVYLNALYFANEQNIFKKYIALLSLGYFFILIGTFGYGNLMRITLYFIIFTIIVFPNIANMLRITYGKNIASLYIWLNIVYLFYFSVPNMLAYKTDNSTGFGSYMFSFLV